MDKEVKQTSSKRNGRSQPPPKRGQIKVRILEDLKEKVMGSKKCGDCSGSDTNISYGRGNCSWSLLVPFGWLTVALIYYSLHGDDVVTNLLPQVWKQVSSPYPSPPSSATSTALSVKSHFSNPFLATIHQPSKTSTLTKTRNPYKERRNSWRAAKLQALATRASLSNMFKNSGPNCLRHPEYGLPRIPMCIKPLRAQNGRLRSRV